ncbi:tyrosinase-like [Lissotriton helveticus]
MAEKVACGDSTIYSFCRQAVDPTQRYQLRRAPKGPWSLPTEIDFTETVAWQEYDVPPFNTTSKKCFRSIAEGFMDPRFGVNEGQFMHNLVHITVGGHMQLLTMASNDPIFYVHHAQIDRMCAKWQWVHCKSSVDYPENDVPCQGPKDNIYASLPPKPLDLYLNPPGYFGYSYSDQALWEPSPCQPAS